ncbi:hypothetical protein TNCV_3826331 [Trichonephila clavipes]|nr:hypothetical protein TNCV_3826331 [Trichonephila clavipes]
MSAHPSIRDRWALRCMSRGPDQVVSLKRDPQYLSPQASFSTHLSTHCKLVSLRLKHLRFDIFELLETKLPVRLINTTNKRRLVKGHETTPLRVKGDIRDVFL